MTMVEIVREEVDGMRNPILLASLALAMLFPVSANGEKVWGSYKRYEEERERAFFRFEAPFVACNALGIAHRVGDVV